MGGSIPRVGIEDIGSYWLGPDNKLWELYLFCEYPTVSWRRVDDRENRRGGAVGSEITRGFRRLVPEQEGSA